MGENTFELVGFWPFTVTFESMDVGKRLGYDNITVHAIQGYSNSPNYYAIGERGLHEDVSTTLSVMVSTPPYDVTEVLPIETENSYNTIPEMLNNIKNAIYPIKMLEYRNGKTHMRGAPWITKLTFLNGLNHVLGFEKTEFDNFGQTKYESEYSPRIESGIRCMYIYASICAPIQVDDTRVPLLRSIWPYKKVPRADKLNIGGFQHMSVKQPMYVDVASNCFNSIEVNIRTDIS